MGRGEQQCADQRGERISGQRQNHHPTDHAERQRLSGLQRQRQLAAGASGVADRRHDVVGVTSGDAARTDQEVVGPRDLHETAGQAPAVVAATAKRCDMQRRRLEQRGEHRSVAVVDLMRRERSARRDELAARREDADLDPAPHRDLGDAAGGLDRHMAGIDHRAGVDDRGAGSDVLSAPSDVETALRRAVERDFRPDNPDLFFHHDGIDARRDRRAGQQSHDLALIGTCRVICAGEGRSHLPEALRRRGRKVVVPDAVAVHRALIERR
jgi:hypothetical protein